MFTKKKDSINEEYVIFSKKLLIIISFLVWWYIFLQVKDIVVMLFFATFLNILFSPMLNFLNKYRIKDWLGIAIIYFVLILLLLIVFFTIIPIFVEQLANLKQFLLTWITEVKNIYNTKWIDWFNLPWFIKNFIVQFDINSLINSIKENLSSILGFFSGNFKNFLSNWAGIVFSVTNGLFTFILTMSFAFFMALERKSIRSFFYKIIPTNISIYLEEREDKIVDILFNWFKWQIILSISIFFITLIWLLILRLFWIHITSIFSLALIAWMMEFVPYFWPVLALLPALAIAISLGFTEVITIIILYIIIQQLENNLFVPYIMSKTLDVSPFAIFIGMIIGAGLFGIVWILIAVPVVSIIQLFVNDRLENK